MGRFRRLLHGLVLLTLVSALAFHWQVHAKDPTEGAFKDADRRLRGEGPGGKRPEFDQLVFEVPRGTQLLRIGTVIDMDGSVTITLTDPRGHETVERMDGDTTASNCCWKRIESPRSGTWEVEVVTRGEGAYVLGFYFGQR